MYTPSPYTQTIYNASLPVSACSIENLRILIGLGTNNVNVEKIGEAGGEATMIMHPLTLINFYLSYNTIQ